jgi:ABC-type iron transport system FetAB ATPase subunit
LLLDEPTSALDEKTAFSVERTLVKHNCIWITHDSLQAKRIATDTLTLLGNDVIAEDLISIG